MSAMHNTVQSRAEQKANYGIRKKTGDFTQIVEKHCSWDSNLHLLTGPRCTMVTNLLRAFWGSLSYTLPYGNDTFSLISYVLKKIKAKNMN